MWVVCPPHCMVRGLRTHDLPYQLGCLGATAVVCRHTSTAALVKAHRLLAAGAAGLRLPGDEPEYVSLLLGVLVMPPVTSGGGWAIFFKVFPLHITRL